MENKPNIDKSWALMESMLDAQLPGKNRDNRGVILMLFPLVLTGAILIIAIIKFSRDKNPLHSETQEFIVLSKHNDSQSMLLPSIDSTAEGLEDNDITIDGGNSNKFVLISEIVQLSSESSKTQNFNLYNHENPKNSLSNHSINIDEEGRAIRFPEGSSSLISFTEIKESENLINGLHSLDPLDFRHHTVRAQNENQLALNLSINSKQKPISTGGSQWDKNRIFSAGGILTQNRNGTEIGIGYNRTIYMPSRRLRIIAGFYFNKSRFDSGGNLSRDTYVEVNAGLENMDEKEKLIFSLPDAFFSASTNLGVEYQLWNNYYLTGGLQYSLRLFNDANAAFVDGASNEGYFSNEINENSVLNRSDLRLQIGAGYRFSSVLDLAILYHQGTIPLINQSLQPNRNVYFGSFMLTMGYNF